MAMDWGRGAQFKFSILDTAVEDVLPPALIAPRRERKAPGSFHGLGDGHVPAVCDVKLAVFMGLLLGPLPTVQAIFYGVFLAGVASIGVIALHRSLKGSIAYGPYLAAGALIVLYMLA